MLNMDHYLLFWFLASKILNYVQDDRCGSSWLSNNEFVMMNLFQHLATFDTSLHANPILTHIMSLEFANSQ